MTANIEERNSLLVERLINGDSTARDEMILLNRPLVLLTVRRVLRASKCRHPQADLVGVGLIALVQAVDRLIQVADVSRSVRNYLITAIRSKLSSELRRQRSYYKKHQHVGSYDSLPEVLLAAEDKRPSDIETREALFKLCETDQECEILQLLREGHSQREIAARLGMERHAVWAFVRRFKKKVEKKMWRV